MDHPCQYHCGSNGNLSRNLQDFVCFQYQQVSSLDSKRENPIPNFRPGISCIKNVSVVYEHTVHVLGRKHRCRPGNSHNQDGTDLADDFEDLMVQDPALLIVARSKAVESR